MLQTKERLKPRVRAEWPWQATQGLWGLAVSVLTQAQEQTRANCVSLRATGSSPTEKHNLRAEQDPL